MDEPVKVNNVRRIKVSIAINYTRQTIIPYLAKRIPRPYIKGLDDDRRGDAITLLNVVENEDDEIRKALNRIIFLSNSIKE